MAFVAADFSLVNYSGNGFHIWHYKSDDLATAIDAAGYFNTVANEVNVGDVIFAHADADGTPTFGIFVVNANDGSTVDVANITNLAGTDSD